ncbi:MAG: MBOAT family protein [Clostridia bacterium]|nr:MBOAT family protein [Clostridia bacterium]
MVFSSTVFLFLFLPAVLALYYIPRTGREYKNTVLLSASLAFYAWGEPAFVFVMLGFVLINWFAGLKIGAAQTHGAKKAWLTAAVALDIALIVVFKYLGFLSFNFLKLFGREAFALKIALPIGISFFTFQIMSYVFDVYYGHAAVQRRPDRLALYISMFPQLIAGPIVRYETVAREIGERRENREDFCEGMARFITGLAKKVLIANYAGLCADNVFSLEPRLIAVGTAWLGAVAYMVQIYFDFSGYSDMAIGLGRMFGFRFDENFDYPYVARSATEFWRRWHMSLSGWFRDYVYIPLGGNRGGTAKTIRNLFAVWLLTGVWHGANWTFVLWGLYWFVLLVTEKQTGLAKCPNAFGHVTTLLLVLFGWVLFRSESIGACGAFLGAMFGAGSGQWADTLTAYLSGGSAFALIAGAVFAFPVVPKLKERFGAHPAVRGIVLAVLFAVSAMLCVKSTYNPFIYFNF